MANVHKTGKIEPKTAPPETLTPPEESPTPPPPKKRGRGNPGAGYDRIPRVQSFLQRVQGIHKDDWGTRAWIHIYRTRPLIDRLRSGQPKKLGKYGQPIDDEWIKANHGSGTYRLFLTFKAPTEANEKELDTVDIDIFDPKFPPNIPDVEWLNIPENKDWEWCRPLLMKTVSANAPTGAPMGSVVETFQLFNEIRKSAADEIRQSQPPPAAPGTDPMATAMSFATQILSIRSENPMVDSLREDMKAVREELTAARKHNEELTMKLFEARTTPPPPAADNLTVFATTMKSIFETFKSTKDTLAELSPATAGRSRMSPWMEFFQPVLPGALEILKPIVNAAATAAAQPNGPAARPPGLQPNAPAAANGQDRFVRLLHMIFDPLMDYLNDKESPANFATWLYSGWGDGPLKAARNVGAPAVIAWYKAQPEYAPRIAPIEPQLTEFLTAVLQWQSPDAKPEPEPEPSSDGVIDLDGEPVGASN